MLIHSHFKLGAKQKKIALAKKAHIYLPRNASQSNKAKAYKQSKNFMAITNNASAANSAKNESAKNAQGLNNLAAQAAAFAAANISASNGSGGAAAKYNLAGFNAYFAESAKSIGKSQRLKIRRAKESAINKLIAAYAAQDAANIKAAKAQFLAFCGQIYFGIESASASQLSAGLLANANGNAQNKEAANLALQILQA